MSSWASTTSRVSVGIMASGTGSNFAALLSADISPGRITAFATDKPGCGAECRAHEAGLPVFSAPIAKGRKQDFEAAVIRHFREHGVAVVALCGYMRIVSPTFIEAFPAGVLNIHPSLLPAFPGLNGPAQAFAHGVKVAGCTIHLVDAGMDTGPILAQATVPVADDDDESTLAARILREEHRLYAPTLAAWCRGEFAVQGRRVIRAGSHSDSISKARQE
jgi:phosphoribosylglycinamide formyltransferase-1